MKHIKQPQRGYLDTPQACLYYETLGEGTPLVLLHGNGQSHRIFSFYARRLCRRYRVILPDSRGHGRSRLHGGADAGFTIADMAGDVASLLDALGLPAAILLGFSDGANIALEFASRFPERALAVISASGNARPEGLRLPFRLGARALRAGCRILLPHLPEAAPYPRALLVRWQLLASLIADSPDLPAGRLGQIKSPVLLLAGTLDLVKTSHTRWMAAAIPKSRLCLIRGGTHGLLFGRRRLCLACILRFLECCGL